MAMLQVLDEGDVVSISFDDLLKYHGRSSIAGVAHGFKVMERAFPLLCPGQPPDRYSIEVETAFPGPGARDAFEMVARVVTGGRYRVTVELAPAHVPDAPEGKFFFRLGYQAKTVDLTLRPEHVNDEFTGLVRKGARTRVDDERLVALKQDIADRLMALPAEEVYDASRA
ncbi:MAG: hypothetical protein CYG61_09935 [Actinobacteria bacterium]|nr:MAG: hypothetical protein CYG61_09935 [Actinomycetota bacterium]